MSIKVLCSYSAIDILCNGTNRHDITDSLTRSLASLPVQKDVPSEKDVLFFAESYNIELPVHLVIPRKLYRRDAPFKQHFMPSTVPPCSYIRISKYIYVTCPELSLLQIANDCPIHQLVFLINQLCGTYYIDENDPFLQVNREPITSFDKIDEFLSQSSDTDGIKKLLRARHYSTEGCNSIREAAIATIMLLPFSLGGYNLPPTHANFPVKLSKEGSNLLGMDFCRPDFSWNMPKKVALEYDSNLTHLTPEQHARDKKRIDALKMTGHEVRTMVADQFRSLESMDQFFTSFRHTLGLHSRNTFLDKNKSTRLVVFKDLFKH